MRTWIMACTLAAATSWHAAAQDMVVPLKDERNRRLAMENAVLRVWEVNVPVGEWGEFHEHSKDTLSVRLNTTTVVNEPKGRLINLVRDFPVEAGSVSFVDYGSSPYVHRITAKGTKSHHLIEVEFLGKEALPGAAERPQRAGFTQILDNARMRASRLILDPRQSTETLAPARNTLVVVVRGGQELKTADVRWYPEAGPRSIRNDGAAPIELVEVEV